MISNESDYNDRHDRNDDNNELINTNETDILLNEVVIDIDINEMKDAEDISSSGELCKYCLESIDVESKYVVLPCSCKTYVHRKCLEEWFDKSGRKVRCEICNTKYNYKPLKDGNYFLGGVRLFLYFVMSFIYGILSVYAFMVPNNVYGLAYRIQDEDQRDVVIVLLIFGLIMIPTFHLLSMRKIVERMLSINLTVYKSFVNTTTLFVFNLLLILMYHMAGILMYETLDVEAFPSLETSVVGGWITYMGYAGFRILEHIFISCCCGDCNN